MKKAVMVAVVIILLGTTGMFAWLHFRDSNMQRELVEKVRLAQEELSVTRQRLLGYTKYTDYVIAGKKAMEGQQKFLAATVRRGDTIVEHVEESMGILKCNATVMVKYETEFAIGFDVRPDSFAIAGDSNKIVVTLRKPELVASPSVNIVSHEILNRGICTDEKGAIIALQQRLLPIALKHAEAIVREPAVTALAEKTFGAFLLDFMGKQTGVKFVPAVQFAYK